MNLTICFLVVVAGFVAGYLSTFVWPVGDKH